MKNLQSEFTDVDAEAFVECVNDINKQAKENGFFWDSVSFSGFTENNFEKILDKADKMGVDRNIFAKQGG